MVHRPVDENGDTISDINKNKTSYLKKCVQLDKIIVSGWWARNSQGVLYDNATELKNAITKSDYKIVLLCYTGSDYIEIVIDKPTSWDFDFSKLSDNLNNAKSISVKGIVTPTVCSWNKHPNIGSVSIDHITWHK